MNIFFLTLIIFVIVYFLLNWFVKTSSKKISNGIRTITIILSVILAITMAYAGRFLFSLPFLLMVLPLVKTKLGLSLFQFLRNLSRPHILIICIKVSPALVLIKGKIIRTKGKENIHLPA